jgi:hypothetical protein
VLSTEIRTQIGGGKSEETVADETRKLSAGEADALLGECARHPIALLAGVVRGELRFRFLGLRTRAGRRVALLERVDDSRPRLRIGIEVGSGLLRTVETVLRRPGVGLVQVLDGYDDYRSAGALRVPMHRVTTVDGGSGGVESTYEKFEILDR